MIIATANIRNYPDMPRAKVVADAKEVAARADLWGQQENNPVEDDEAISKALGDKWAKVGGGINLPIWFRRDKLECVSYRVAIADFDPVLPLTPRPRTISVGRFALKGRRGLEPLTLINNHRIAGGLNGPTEPPRARQWHIEEARAREVYAAERRKKSGALKVKELDSGRMELNSDHDALWVEVSLSAATGNRTVFYLGDFNNPEPPKPAKAFRWLVGERLDRIGVSTP